MAAAKKDALDYNALVKKLRSHGVLRLYLLYGEEDYLRDLFVNEIRAVCLPDGGSEWSHKRLAFPEEDLDALEEAVVSVPFLSERVLVEYRGFEINACRDARAERLGSIISDIPEWCTLVLLTPAGYEPDGRLAAFKAVKKLGETVNFTAQSQSLLPGWVARRFEALGVSAEKEACEQLIFMTGGLMGRLLPEIEKLAYCAENGVLTAERVRSAAIKFPEASVFELTELIAAREYKKAAAVLSELLDMRAEPVMILAMLGKTMRQLYMARLILDRGQGVRELMGELELRFEFIARRLLSGARGFDAASLRACLRLCAETDFAMKGARSAQGAEPLKELLMLLAAGRYSC